MKNVYIIILAFLFSIPALAQETKKKETPREVSVLCTMPGKNKGQWLTLKIPTPGEVADFQDKLIYLELLDKEEVTERGVFNRATSDAILRMEKARGVTYNTNELTGITQGMKNRLILAYYTAKRAQEGKQ
ncbi:hypothetical protein [uncultured Kordia sp.]|uniref:hypothetical protein n=1 Tax=uncultured Kordia sp. TaxID=507699 RepID=UPI0026190BCA|nr:hypothetical protein [uncultured Kordia sp.]